MAAGFEEAVAAFEAGSLGPEDLTHRLLALAAAAPEAASEILADLEEPATAVRIPDHVREPLIERVGALVVGGTVLRTSPPPPPPASEAAGVGPGAGGEAGGATVVTGRPEAAGGNTVVTPHVPPAGPAEGAAPGREPAVGDVIKGRFVLETLLGRGGMGMVFKARDLRKEEAQDRNPFVAIKLLGASFKDHPQALIALQREARKSQDLAHPNIVNVFDFDRDGDIVYMVMELLDGDPLDEILRDLYPNPMPTPDALKVVEGICLGLAHAHKSKIIHSDLKPGNVFITKQGQVKVFDFGIARAMKMSDEATGTTTVFDAGSLGGLTPAYATCEMWEGADPDVRDDVYALACIAYELLGGRHPYARKPAPKARDEGLTPAPIKGLKRRQWRALEQGLALSREARVESVDAFLKGISPERAGGNRQKVLGAILLVVLAGAAVQPVRGVLEQRTVDGVVAELASGDAARVQAALGGLDQQTASVRAKALSQAKDAVIAYYTGQAEVLLNPAKGQPNFIGADRVLKDAQQLYPDSAKLASVASAADERRHQLLNRLTARFNASLEKGLLLPGQGDDVPDLLTEVAAIDPSHPLLTDKRLAVAYAEKAEAAARSKKVDQAEALVTAGINRFPDDPALLNLRDVIRSQREGLARGDVRSLEEANRRVKRQRYAAMPPEQVAAEVDALMAKPLNGDGWDDDLQAALDALSRRLPADNPVLAGVREKGASAYLAEARKMRDAGRFSRADTYLARAREIDPGLPGLNEEKQRLASERARFERQRAAEAQKAQIEGLRQTILTEARANDVKHAQTDLAQLGKLVPANDTFVKQTAPEAIAQAYQRLAADVEKRKEYAAALDLVNAGLAMAPTNRDLLSSRARLKDLASPDPCKPSFAGHGTRARATCADALKGGGTGPLLVVVPAGGGFSAPFAIGKYEVSVGDYNLYCKESGACTARGGDPDLPLTGVSFAEIKRYADWLGKTTGYTYRPATEAEWVYAAGAGGGRQAKEFNCTVFVGGHQMKGNALLGIRTGSENAWGLTNYLGNAQEWVVGPGGRLVARGGDYTDPLSECAATLSRRHDGSPDPLTGVRLVRELSH